MTKIQITLAEADPHIVRLFTNHLISAFEDFANSYPGGVNYSDGFMTANNFHRVIVAHLVSETETGRDVLWSAALDTFAEAVERELQKLRGDDPAPAG